MKYVLELERDEAVLLCEVMAQAVEVVPILIQKLNDRHQKASCGLADSMGKLLDELCAHETR